MLNAAMVLMILAGIFGLPAAACSTMCAGLGAATGARQGAPEGQTIMEALMWLALIASIGSIIVGALVKKLGKMVSGFSALLFCGIFATLLVQMNILGIMSSLMLLVAAIMIFVAPQEQFHNIQRVEVGNRGGAAIAGKSVQKETIYCSECGSKNAKEAAFCTDCGHKLS